MEAHESTDLAERSDNDRLANALQGAKFEIEHLRRANEILRAKVEMIDLFTVVLATQPARGQGQDAGPDVAWSLQREIDHLQKRKEEENLKKQAHDEAQYHSTAVRAAGQVGKGMSGR